MNENKVSSNQSESDDINHLKNQKSISTKVIQGQRYKSLSCLYSKLIFTKCICDSRKRIGTLHVSINTVLCPILQYLVIYIFVKGVRSMSRNVFNKKQLFKKVPILGWLPKYNVQTGVSDLIAGITVGLTIIPQGIAYALVANLPPQV